MSKGKKIYVCHIPGEDFTRITSDSFVKVVKQFKTAFIQDSPDFLKYMGAFAFADKNEMLMFVQTCNSQFGTHFEADNKCAFIDEQTYINTFC